MKTANRMNDRSWQSIVLRTDASLLKYRVGSLRTVDKSGGYGSELQAQAICAWSANGDKPGRTVAAAESTRLTQTGPLPGDAERSTRVATPPENACSLGSHLMVRSGCVPDDIRFDSPVDAGLAPCCSNRTNGEHPAEDGPPLRRSHRASPARRFRENRFCRVLTYGSARANILGAAWPQSALQGARLQGGVRCRACDARGRPVVSIKWASWFRSDTGFRVRQEIHASLETHPR